MKYLLSSKKKKIQYLGRYIYILLAKRRDIKSGVGLKIFLTFLYTPIYLVVGTYHRYKGQLCLPPLIWNVSHLTIFPLELLGLAIGFSADPSSSKGKIVRLETTTNSPNNKQMSLIRCDINKSNCSTYYLHIICSWYV